MIQILFSGKTVNQILNPTFKLLCIAVSEESDTT